jgi:hypothetical protein
MRTTSVLTGAIAVFAFTASANAEVLYQTDFNPNIFPSHTAGFISNANVIELADRFALASQSSITSVSVDGYFLFFPPTKYRIDIFPELTSIKKPSNDPAVTFRSSDFTSQPSGYFHASNVEIFSLTFALPNTLQLDAGAYWLSVVNEDTSSTSFAWNQANGAAGFPPLSFRANASANWQLSSLTPHLAFRVLGSPSPIPEPTTAALMLLGILCFGVKGLSGSWRGRSGEA